MESTLAVLEVKTALTLEANTVSIEESKAEVPPRKAAIAVQTTIAFLNVSIKSLLGLKWTAVATLGREQPFSAYGMCFFIQSPVCESTSNATYLVCQTSEISKLLI
jgi:hypothetical protein